MVNTPVDVPNFGPSLALTGWLTGALYLMYMATLEDVYTLV